MTDRDRLEPKPTDICECGHEAIRHFWHSIDRKYGKCSLETCASECKKFVLAKDGRRRCPTCGQLIKKA